MYTSHPINRNITVTILVCTILCQICGFLYRICTTILTRFSSHSCYFRGSGDCAGITDSGTELFLLVQFQKNFLNISELCPDRRVVFIKYFSDWQRWDIIAKLIECGITFRYFSSKFPILCLMHFLGWGITELFIDV